MGKAHPVSCNSIVEDRLNARATDIEKHVKGHVLSFHAPIYRPIDDYVRDLIERKAGSHKRSRLMVILQTGGGMIEVARRIADTLHHHYRSVEYLIPNYAYSAGTVLAMSGDAIYMDHYSVLGPIDPQVKRNNQWVPGLGYVEKFDKLMEKAAKPGGGLNTAEMTYMVEHFDPAFLYQIEQERDLSVSLLKEWLVKYKFKNWKWTETNGAKVTKKLKTHRAESIAKKLNDTGFWHSHSRGIPMSVARKVLNLKIDDFSLDEELNKKIKAYYHLFTDYMGRREHDIALHQAGTYVGFN
ncbi:MAG TPA: hypothetical protein VGG19_18130 [Tepidisphaeraceae bacterium]|jgi:hypothetical protein